MTLTVCIIPMKYFFLENETASWLEASGLMPLLHFYFCSFIHLLLKISFSWAETQSWLLLPYFPFPSLIRFWYIKGKITQMAQRLGSMWTSGMWWLPQQLVAVSQKKHHRLATGLQKILCNQKQLLQVL